LLVSVFAEPRAVLNQYREDLYRVTASLPFPLPTYSTDVLSSSVCIFQGQRARPIKLLYIGLVVLRRELRPFCPLSKFIAPRDEILKVL
jgi:hypothetical protein